MAYRSWLKDVRKINDLAEFLHEDKWSLETQDRQWEKEKKGLNLCRNRELPVEPNSTKYFGAGLHDGYVFGVEKKGDRLEIKVANSALLMFWQNYLEFKGRDWEPLLSPVTLVFEGVNYVNAVRADIDGWLKWSNWTSWRPLDDLRCADTLIRDWFFHQDGKLQWICQFWKYGPESDRLGSSLFLLVDFERAYAVPEHDSLIRARMGDECFVAWKQYDDVSTTDRQFVYMRNFADIIQLQTERETNQ